MAFGGGETWELELLCFNILFLSETYLGIRARLVVPHTMSSPDFVCFAVIVGQRRVSKNVLFTSNHKLF